MLPSASQCHLPPCKPPSIFGSADFFILVTMHHYHRWPTISGYYIQIFHLWGSVAFQCCSPRLAILIRMRNTVVFIYILSSLTSSRQTLESLNLITRTTLATVGSQFLVSIDNFTCNMFKHISFSCRNRILPFLSPISEVHQSSHVCVSPGLLKNSFYTTILYHVRPCQCKKSPRVIFSGFLCSREGEPGRRDPVANPWGRCRLIC